MTGSVRGYVVNEDGTPVADATIIVVRGAGPVPDIAPVTDDHGSFALDGLPEGNWRLRAQSPGGEVGEVGVVVFDDSVSEATLVVVPEQNC